jgi:hypothetical protein
MSMAGTPFSTSVKEFQLIPLALVKNKFPDPLCGTLKLKLAPTFTHCPQCPGMSAPPPAPWRMILGSCIGSANAKAEAKKNSKVSVRILEIFI